MSALPEPRLAARCAPAPALVAAQAAMTSGCRFLVDRGQAAGAAGGAQRAVAGGRVAMRRAGNCLKELDRLLSILLDECARAGGMTAGRHRVFERSHDTARKLRRIDMLNGGRAADTVRLRAIARLRDLACDGHLPGYIAFGPHDLAVATAGLAGVGAGMQITDQALGAIARFYLNIARRLLGYYRVSAAQLDFSTDQAHTAKAIVACDGI